MYLYGLYFFSHQSCATGTLLLPKEIYPHKSDTKFSSTYFLTLTKQEINTAANWIKSMSGESLVGRGEMQKSYVLSGHSTIHRTNHA